jgi:glycosyltransferase 2 family protein
MALLKLAVSVTVLVLVAARVPFEEVMQRARDGAPLYLFAALLPVLLGVVLVAVRWRLVAAWLGVAISTSLAVRALFLGFLGAQVLPSAIGGDFVRGWLLARHGARVSRVVASLVADRLVGVFGVCLLLLLTTPVVRQLPPPYDSILAPAAVLASGTVLAAFLLLNRAALRAGALLVAVALALVIHALNVAVAVLAAKAYGIDPAFDLWLAVIPLAVLAAAIPISINGWGVREAAIVMLAAPLGVPAAQALLVSLTLGVLNAIASLPGVAVMLSGRRG